MKPIPMFQQNPAGFLSTHAFMVIKAIAVHASSWGLGFRVATRDFRNQSSAKCDHGLFFPVGPFRYSTLCTSNAGDSHNGRLHVRSHHVLLKEKHATMVCLCSPWLLPQDSGCSPKGPIIIPKACTIITITQISST